MTAARHLAAARDRDIAEMRAKFDMTAAGLGRIASMIEQRGDDR